MPVWTRVTSLMFCAHTVGKPSIAVDPAIAAPPLRIVRRETCFLKNSPAFFIVSLLPLFALSDYLRSPRPCLTTFTRRSERDGFFEPGVAPLRMRRGGFIS